MNRYPILETYLSWLLAFAIGTAMVALAGGPIIVAGVMYDITGNPYWWFLVFGQIVTWAGLAWIFDLLGGSDL